MIDETCLGDCGGGKRSVSELDDAGGGGIAEASGDEGDTVRTTDRSRDLE